MSLTFSIIIPVLDESRIINRTLSLLFHSGFHRRAEIIVVDGHPSGTTLREISDFDVIKLTAPAGRGLQMNTGARHASGDMLIFLHADTRMPAEALNEIAAVLSRSENDLVGGAFDLKIASDAKIFRLIEKIASLRSRITRIPYGDQTIFLRRRFFLGMGGFELIPLMEDLALMKRIKNLGEKIVFLDARVCTSARRWEEEGILYCILRNWALTLLYLMGVSPDKLSRFYRFSRHRSQGHGIR